MEKIIYKVADIHAGYTWNTSEPTKWGKSIHLGTATQEQLKYLFEVHKLQFVYTDKENGTKD